VQVELRQLRYFVAVAEELHFRRAAERLLLTQPALSHQIARLESQLGVRLLERDRRSVALTPAGATLLEGARRALFDIDQSIAATRWTSGITSHVLRLGYPAYATRALREVLNAFRERHPDLWIDEHQLQSHRIHEGLLNRTLDAGFMNLPVGGALTTVPVVPRRMTVVLPATHPLATHERVPLARLAGRPLLMAGASVAPSYRAALMVCCQQVGFVPAIVEPDGREPPTMEGLARAVAGGQGLLLLPPEVPEPLLPELACRPVDLPPRSPELTLAWHSGNPSPSIKAFSALVRANSPVGS
jgi:DNA-binding transcriptional LysR family regulator